MHRGTMSAEWRNSIDNPRQGRFWRRCFPGFFLDRQVRPVLWLLFDKRLLLHLPRQPRLR